MMRKNGKDLHKKQLEAIEQDLYAEWDKKIGELLSDPVDADYWFRDNTQKKPSRILNTVESDREN